MVKVLAGLTEYRTALCLQQKYNARQSTEPSSSSDLLLFLQHPPTYTAGRRLRDPNLIASETKRLSALGASFHAVHRGGQLTFHGPGQFIGYPLIYLKQSNYTVKCFVHGMEEVLIRMLQQRYQLVHAMRSPHTGVWVLDKKIAAMGIHVSRHLTMHGFALNNTVDLDWFKHIVPCGLVGKGVTSLEKERGTGVEMSVLVNHVRASFEDVFQRPLVDVDKDTAHWIEQTLHECSKESA